MKDSRTYDSDFESIVEDLREIFGGDYPAVLTPLGDAIKAIRIERFGPRSQGKLAIEAGIDASTISRYEGGKTKTTEAEKLYAISFALGVPLDRVADVKLPSADAQFAITARRLLKDQMFGQAPDEFRELIRFEEDRSLRFGIPLGWQLGSLDFFRYFQIAQATKHLDQAKADVVMLLKIDSFPHELSYDDIGEDINLVLAHYAVQNEEKHAAICIGMSGARQAYATMYLNSAAEAFDDEARVEMRAWGMTPLVDLPSRIVPNRESTFLAIRDRNAKTSRELLDFMLKLAE